MFYYTIAKVNQSYLAVNEGLICTLCVHMLPVRLQQKYFHKAERRAQTLYFRKSSYFSRVNNTCILENVYSCCYFFKHRSTKAFLSVHLFH